MTSASGSSSAAGPSGGAGAPGAARRRGGPPAVFFLIGAGGTLLGALIVLAQVLGVGAGPGGLPAPTAAPPGAAAQRTRDLVASALETRALQVVDPQTAYRPGESPELAQLTRRLVQVVLPDEPTGGYIVIYELPTVAEADRLGRDFRAYLASGTGAIQYPRDTQFVIRRVGSTLVFFPWSLEASTDARVPLVAETLSTLGEPLTSG